MKLYAVIQDREAGTEKVVLCQFEGQDGEMVFVEDVERHDKQMFHVLVDEGYVYTHYYYPVERFSITHLEIYE